jgi:DNA-binding transcriptional LysR family regulator
MMFDQLKTFAAAAKYRSVTKAARELGVSQPGVSRQLKLLEAHIGGELYRRLSNGIELTEKGQLFLRRLTPILDQIAKLTGEFKASVQRSKKMALHVGGTFNVSALLLPALLARFQRLRPYAELELRTCSPEHLESLLIANSIAIGVTICATKSPLLAREPLRREKIVMFVPADHRLSKKAHPPLAQIMSEPLIIRGVKGSFSATELVLSRLRENGLRLKIGMRCEGPSEVKAAVRERMGIGLAFEDTVKIEAKAGEFKILKVRGLKMEGQSYIVYRKDRPLSPLAQEFLAILRRARSGSRSANPATRINLSMAHSVTGSVSGSAPFLGARPGQ